MSHQPQTWHYGLVARWWAEFNAPDPDELAFLFSGGIKLDIDYTPGLLYQLAKMDGGIVLNANATKIAVPPHTTGLATSLMACSSALPRRSRSRGPRCCPPRCLRLST